MSDNTPNLRRVDAPLADTAVVETLRSALEAAERGEVRGIALIVSLRGGEWQQTLAGSTMYHDVAGLNLRIDMLKGLLMRQVEVVAETRDDGDAD